MSYNILNECYICLECVTKQCDVAQNECGHLFHKNCLREWMDSEHNHQIGNVCPVCSRPLNIPEKKRYCSKKRNICVIL